MPDCRSRLSLWATFATMLLASVIVAPIRTPGYASPRPDRLCRDLILPPHSSIGLSATPVGKEDVRVDAVDAEEEKDEEQKFESIPPSSPTLTSPHRTYHRVAFDGLSPSPSRLTCIPLRC